MLALDLRLFQSRPHVIGQISKFPNYGSIIIGAKMLLSEVIKVPVAALTRIVFILLICVIVSLLWPRRADLKLMFERTERLGLIPFRRLC